MNKNKSKKILIAIIILVILIAITVGGIAYAYFATDIFKTEKEMFFKYGSQIFEENGFIEKSISTYYEKQGTTPFANEGMIQAEIENDNIDKLDEANDFYISFSGNADTVNSKAEQEIILNYSEDVTFPLNYRQDGNKLALQTKYVGSKYIALRNDNTEDLLGQINIDTSAIEKLENLSITQDELENIMNKYADIINQYLNEEKFSKITDSNGTGYKLTLNEQELKQISLAILEVMKDDEELLDMLNETADEEINKEQIEEMIEQLNETEIEQQNIEITIYQNNGNLNQITINVNEIIKIEIVKNKNAEELQYNVIIAMYEDNEEMVNVNISAKYTGLQELETVGENYEIGFAYKNGDDTVSYKYIVNNNISFTNSVDIEDIDEDNSIILNDQDSEYVSNLTQAIIQRIQDVNKDQMEKMGLAENENPLIYWFSWVSDLLITSNATNTINNDVLNEVEVSSFNNKFLVYEGTNLRGATAKGLLTVIQANNSENDTKITEINFDGEEYEVTDQNITLIKSNILVEEAYKIEFEYDRDTGMIYRAIINKK